MKTFEEKSIESYNKKADDYDNTFDGRFTEKFKQLLLEEMVIKTEDTVLDIACGNGKLLKRLSDKYYIKGYGIDISDKMVDSAKIKYPDLHFQVSSCDESPFQDQMFDVMSVCAAYHHFPDVKKFADEVTRILKPQGQIYIAEVYYPFVIRAVMNPFIPLSKAGDVRFYSPKEITDNFKQHGFNVIKHRIDGNIQLIGMQKKG